MSKTVTVKLWGTAIGYLGYATGEEKYAVFEYDPAFLKSGIQISPIHMNYPPSRYLFDQLSFKSFKGLPGIFTDSLPDKYGSQLIDLYMADKNIPPQDVTSLDRLLYVGNRAVGALEYHPGESLSLKRTALDLQKLSELSDIIQKEKDDLWDKIHSQEDRAAALSLIRIGSSAGGARSKAVIALSSKDHIFDGTVSHGENYSYWVLKFESSGNIDRDSKDPKGMPVVEYIYSKIAASSGIDIPRTKLLGGGEDRHFLIERFDRIIKNHKVDKLHYASWAGLAHADRDGENSYEQLVLLARQMNLGQSAVTEIFRRAVFNIIGRNQDDHTKNTGFLMDRNGKWRLSPAFDLTYSYDPSGKWTGNHQCRLNGKNNNFDINDLLDFGKFCNINEKKSREIVFRIYDSFKMFSSLAEEYKLPADLKKTVENNMRLNIIS